MSEKSSRVIVTVIGQDKVGIIAAVSGVLAEGGANIIDISQTTLREFFTMIMMVDLEKATLPFDELKRRLQAKGQEMGLRIDAQQRSAAKEQLTVAPGRSFRIARRLGKALEFDAGQLLGQLAGGLRGVRRRQQPCHGDDNAAKLDQRP